MRLHLSRIVANTLLEVMHNPETPVARQTWREDNWGIASIALASFAFWFTVSSSAVDVPFVMATLMPLASGAVAFGAVAGACARNSWLRAVGLFLNLVMGLQLVFASYYISPRG